MEQIRHPSDKTRSARGHRAHRARVHGALIQYATLCTMTNAYDDKRICGCAHRERERESEKLKGPRSKGLGSNQGLNAAKPQAGGREDSMAMIGDW